MLKQPKARGAMSFLVTGVKVGIAIELAFFGGSYLLWRQMNSSQDFRRRMYKKYPSVLNAYYWVGERTGYQTREMDYKTWGISDQ
ncbi:hypothetical protein SNE40_008654 [Patella caerulea]|uniref:Protein CEBPZOS-like n=1 Tax=Patella caerulea TaxID=87958 RepID=A0AAN8Q1X9_PATCE